MNLSLPCDVWDGQTGTHGYGVVWIEDPERKRTRIYNVPALMAAEWLGVVTSPQMHVDHLCRNRACWEPAHLEVVPCKTNILRGVSNAADNARKTHCNRGHPYDDENTYHARGRRYCRACQRMWSRQWKERQ